MQRLAKTGSDTHYSELFFDGEDVYMRQTSIIQHAGMVSPYTVQLWHQVAHWNGVDKKTEKRLDKLVKGLQPIGEA